ncbi:MAG TPA: L,D-transpeptidase, partial [Terriglobia bacterium]|nr:L,D-transpeptidase [Terriglobia bacterium]
EGTLNENGIMGYGRKGMRIYDFGWVRQAKGWGNGADSFMRLQLHSTDPLQLEWKLGTPQSKGCIRVPATFNAFLDHFGILDADYERRIAEGKKLWVMSPDREPTPWSGRYMVIVDSNRQERPSWSPVPANK